MPAFKAEMIRVIEDGRLRSVGVRWTQPDIVGAKIWAAVYAVCFLAAGILFAVSRAVANGGEAYTHATIIVAIATTVLILLGDDSVQTAVIFHDDGRTETPHGSPGFRRDRCIEGNHRYISNIQLEQGTRMYEVEAAQNFQVGLYCANGDIVVVGDLLRKNQAHKVAVMLTNALNDMRAQLSELPRKRGTAPDPRRTLKPALID